MQQQVQKAELLYTAGGFKVFATGVADLAIMEWESEESCRLALLFHQYMRKHALFTNFDDTLGLRAMLVRRIQPLGFTVRVHSGPNETELTFLSPEGEVLSPEEARQRPYATPTRMDMLTDAATHAARSLRAHLLPLGMHEVTLNLTFGVGPQGECLMQVIDPASCDLGTTDYKALFTQLGGDRK